MQAKLEQVWFVQNCSLDVCNEHYIIKPEFQASIVAEVHTGAANPLLSMPVEPFIMNSGAEYFLWPCAGPRLVLLSQHILVPWFDKVCLGDFLL